MNPSPILTADLDKLYTVSDELRIVAETGIAIARAAHDLFITHPEDHSQAQNTFLAALGEWAALSGLPVVTCPTCDLVGPKTEMDRVHGMHKGYIIDLTDEAGDDY